MTKSSDLWILQFCHCYTGPFMDCARQYAALFKDTPYKVCTVYLTGSPDQAVTTGSASDEVIFLNYSSRQVRGLKLGAIKDIHRISKNRNFKACIAHRFKPIYIALLATKLPVFGVHHAFGDYERATRRILVNFYQKRLTLLAVSNAVRNEIRSCFPSWPNDKIATLYNRIDVEAVQAEQLSRKDAREALKLPQDAWIVGTVGRLHPDKDQATLIRGFAKAILQLPDNSLLAIMGSGKLESALRQLTDELHLSNRVIFLGQIPQGRRYFKAFNLFALTSDHEPFGMVLLEAITAYLPVICSNCGGGREVIAGYGSLFPLGNSDALAQELVACHINEDNPSKPDAQSHLDLFSDDAIRTQFWNLELICSLNQEDTTHV